MKDHADEELLNLWRNDDQEAYGILVVRHYPVVICACRRQAPAGEEEDCAQAVFLVLARKKPTPAECPVLVAWLLRVTTYVCLHAQRAAARRRKVEQATVEAVKDPPAAGSEAEALTHLDECLMRLPERQRTAITLHFLTGKTPVEVAAAMAISRNNAHQLLSRGLAQLRRHYSRRGIVVTSAGLAVLLGIQGQASASEPSRPAFASLVNNPSPTVAALAEGARKMMPIPFSEPMRIGLGLLVIVVLVAWSGLADVIRGKGLVQAEAYKPPVLSASDPSEAMSPIHRKITWNLEFERGIKALAKVHLEWTPPDDQRTRENPARNFFTRTNVPAGPSEQDLGVLEPGDYFIYFEAPGFASQWRHFKITGAGAMVPMDSANRVTLLRNRFAVVRYAFNPTGSRQLTGEDCKTGRVALGHWGGLPSFREDWQMWQGSRTSTEMFEKDLEISFHRICSTDFGAALAPKGTTFDAAIQAPDKSAYQCEDIFAAPGQVIYFRVNGNEADGIGYGKILIEEITETPEPDLEIIGYGVQSPSGIN